ARFDFPGKSLVTTAVMTPLVLPPVVTGFLLLSLLGRNGWLGGTLDAFGVSVPFTLLGATAAALVVGFPLYMMSARSAFEAVDRRYAEVAWTLGDKPAGSFWRVSLPMALPGVLAGAVLAFARALGEFGATIVLAGNIEGQTRTIPLAVYTALETPDGGRVAWLLVGASVGIAALALLGFESLSRAQRRRTGDSRS
ncbi:MAG: molybdate ABC transporter permease subunit, partial [Longimicrobiales bacterium]